MVAVNWVDVASDVTFEINPTYYVGWDGTDAGTGAVDIAAGEVLTLMSNQWNIDLTLLVGDRADATGTVTIDGAGAEFRLPGQGVPNDGVFAAFGIDGGHGDLLIQNGGMFYINDTRGEEYFAVGEDGGTGSVTVTGPGSQFRMTSGDLEIQVGRNTPANGGVSQASFSVLGGASLFVQSNDSLVPGDAGMSIGTGADGFGNAEFQGAAATTDWTAKFDSTATAYLYVGNYEGSDPTTGGGSGVVNIGTGALVSLTGNTGARIGLGRGAGANGELNVSGAGTTLEIHTENIGNSRIEIGVAGGTGILSIVDDASVSVSSADGQALVSVGDGSTLMIADGGTLDVSFGGFSGNIGLISIGAGGTLAGGTGIGTLIGDVEFSNGGGINMVDGLFGTLTFSGPVDANGTVDAAIRLEASATNHDRLLFDGAFTNNSDVAVTLSTVASYKFTAGVTKVLATFDAGDFGNGAVNLSVTGQQADFSYYIGKLAVTPKNLTFIALNNGATAGVANAGVLDFVSGSGAKLVYNSAAQSGVVTGGRFGVDGGLAFKLDDIRGTNGVDNFSVTGTTARTLKFDGKGGNDIIKGGAGIDTIIGGIGNDTLTGNAGNDILQGDAGKDTMTGNAGSDTFKFLLKANSVASHANADIITDFDDGGTGDKIDVSALFGPKMTYIGAAEFTKVGQVRVNDIAGADLIIEINLSGTLASDFAIRLKNTTIGQIGLDDFVL